MTSLQWKVITWHLVFHYYPSPTLANFCPLPPTVCSNGLYVNISNQHQVQQSFDTKVVFDTKIKATTKWQTSNFLIRDGRTRVAQVPSDWGRSGYLTLTERRADHGYQITNYPLCPDFKTFHLPCTLISLINVTSRLPILKNSTLHKSKIHPTRLLIS